MLAPLVAIPANASLNCSGDTVMTTTGDDLVLLDMIVPLLS
jgi:hypothetical protein